MVKNIQDIQYMTLNELKVIKVKDLPGGLQDKLLSIGRFCVKRGCHTDNHIKSNTNLFDVLRVLISDTENNLKLKEIKRPFNKTKR